jgi:hypothetical protein
VSHRQTRTDTDFASLYLGIGVEPPRPIPVVPLQLGHVFTEFPADGAAVAAWRRLPNARVIERPGSIPGLDESTYVVTKVEERRNLFRAPLTR